MADTALPIGALDPAGALEADDKLEIERGEGEGAEGLHTTLAGLRGAIWQEITRADYDALPSPDQNILYLVID